MNTYPAYKHSGEQWLGQIPEHWEMRQWHFLLQENAEPNSDCKETQQLQFKYGEIVPKANQELDADTLKIICKYTKVQPNDIMINGLNLNYDFISQRIGMVRCHGIITSAYISLRPTAETNPSYYNYLLKAMDAQKMFHGMGTGVRLTLSYKELKNKYLPFPPLAEQEAMVAYLDEQTGIIDTAIERERKMIDLLEERKQIIIQQAVTKGLNPNAKMKDSGIEWIGEIPEGWEVRKLKYIGDSKNGLTYSPLDMVDENQGILVLRSSNIQKGKLSFEDNVYVKYAPKKLHVRKGDIIICSRNGSADLVGKCAIIDREMYATFGAFMMRFRSPHNDKYIYYLLSIAISKYKQLFATSTINQLTLGIFADMKVPIVLDELCQQTIVNYLDERLGNINRAIEAREKMIALLQERKQIIINEVVTGKIKVL